MDWSKGYSASYYASLLDKRTMREIPTSDSRYPRIEIMSGSIKRTNSDLRESATIDCRNYSEMGEQLIRVWLDAKQGSESSHTPLFTGIAITPKKSYDGIVVSNSLECYSILKIADDILLPRGWYAPVDVDGPRMVRDLLSVIGVPINIKDDSIEDKERLLSQAIIAESGETRLTMANTILDVINWRLKIDGYGSITIQPLDIEPVQLFDSLGNDVVEKSIDIETDFYDCPNVLRAVSDDLAAEFKDTRDSSILSVQNRGREIWYEETDAALNIDETIAEYAQRRLFELQKFTTNISYDRRYDPTVFPTDVVRLNFPAQKITGLYEVLSQNIDLGYNAKTSEEVCLIG